MSKLPSTNKHPPFPVRPSPPLIHRPLFTAFLLALSAGVARADTVTWTGGTSTDWATGGNWTNSAGAPGAPTSGDDVVIDGGARQPLLNLAGGAVTIKSLALGQTTASTLTFTNGDVSTKRLIVSGDVTIYTNGTLTHAAETATGNTVGNENQRLFVDVGGNMTLAAGGKIDVSGMGYNINQGPGTGGSGAGGGYGGQGGGNTPTYGSVTIPVNNGSGGGTYGGIASRGGGAVVLAIGGGLTLNGSVLADSGASPGYGGGGSGGSINIVAARLSGAGTISAKGGNVPSGAASGDGGGGGRIAVVLTNADNTAFANLTAIRTYGGSPRNNGAYGAAGTIYLKGTNQTYGTLIVNNAGQSTTRTTLYQTNTNQFDTIITTNAARFALGNGAQLTMNGTTWLSDTSSRIIVGLSTNAQIIASSLTIPTNATLSWTGTNGYTLNSDVTVAAGGTMTHETVTTDPENHKLIATIVGSLNVMTGGQISVSAMGYAQNSGPGPGTGGRAGGGHGGEGGETTGGTTYDSLTNPVRAGSGGKSYNGAGGRGGGVVRLTIGGGLTLNGTIAADASVVTGNTSDGYCAGGSVNIAAASLAGGGTISANGGYNTYISSQGSGGGGGRIAIVLNNADDTAFAGLAAIRAYGGPKSVSGSYENGAAGTIYLKGTNTAYGRLIVDNNLPATRRTLVSASVTDPTVGDVILRNQGWLGVASQTLTVYGGWSNAASFSADAGGIVTLAGTGALATNTLFGSTTFGSLLCTNAGKTLLFQAGKTNIVTAGLTLSGSSGAPLSLLPATAGQQWYIKVTNSVTPTLTHLIVSNSTAVTGGNGRTLAAIFSTLSDVGVDNSLGGNTNWSFPTSEDKVWNGSVDTSWVTDANWTPSGEPQIADLSITIPAGGNQPILNASYSYTCPLVIQSGASLSLGGWNLTLGGLVTNAGTIAATGNETLTFTSNVVFTATGAFTPASSTVVLGGSGAQSVTLNGQTFNTLSISNVNAVTVTDTFAARNLTFPSSGANVTFGGGFTATNLTLSVSGAATLNFAAGQTYTVRNALYLRGASSGNRAVLTSSGTWYLNAPGYYVARQLTVAKSDATGSGKILHAIDSSDAGGNTYWDFGAGNQLWVGTNTAWATAGNWSPSGAPGASSFVFVDGSSAFVPRLASATTIAGLTVAGLAGPASLTLALPYGGPDRLTVNGDVNVAANGTLTHPANSGTPTYRLAMTVNGTLNVAAGGLIDVNGMGYAGGQGFGGPGDPGANYSYGAGHGGVGGGAAGGTTYGSVTNPLTLGSSTAGGNGGPIPGGGVVLLSVRDALVVNGAIRADGTTAGASPSLGGGSGGSVNIVAGNVSGTGTVSAAGGSTLAAGCSGAGGGRIAMVLTNADDTAFGGLAAIKAYGGAPSGAGEYGAAGTIYLKGTSQTYGRLLVNNNSQASTRLTLLNSAVTDKTVGDVVLRNLGYMGLSAGETLTVLGGWSNAVATNAISGGTVVFAGTSAATVWGGNTWSNLTIMTAGKTVNFQAGVTQTVYGVPVFSNVMLQSTSAGSYWYLQKPGVGTQDVDVVIVQDSNATNGMTFAGAAGSVNGGNNVNWLFRAPKGTLLLVW